MKSSDIYEISKALSNNLRLFPDQLRLIVPSLLNLAKNKKQFLILFELCKLNKLRGKIQQIIKIDKNKHQELNKLIKTKMNKKLSDKIKFNILKIKNEKEIY